MKRHNDKVFKPMFLQLVTNLWYTVYQDRENILLTSKSTSVRIQESEIMHLKNLASIKPKTYLEKPVYQGGNRFQVLGRFPEMRVAASFKKRNPKKTVPESHPIIMQTGKSSFHVNILPAYQGVVRFDCPDWALGWPVWRELNVSALTSF